MKEQRFDIHQQITNQIVAAIEAGAGEFRLPWHRSDAELANGLQPFDNIGQVPLARGFRPFTQPGERCTLLVVGDDEQRLQSCDRF